MEFGEAGAFGWKTVTGSTDRSVVSVWIMTVEPVPGSQDDFSLYGSGLQQLVGPARFGEGKALGNDRLDPAIAEHLKERGQVFTKPRGAALAG